jgi:hypothetical protein
MWRKYRVGAVSFRKSEMSEAPAVYAVCWNRDAASEALNERRVELGLSLVELDNAARQAAGTAAKYLSPG